MLGKYLDAIERGESVNYRTFLKYVPLKYHKKGHYFSLVKDGVGSKYFIEIIDEEVLKDLRLIANKRNSTDRLDAADLGDSHMNKVSINGFGVRDLVNDEYGLLVLSDDRNVFVPKIVSKENCVIIENREVFYSASLKVLLDAHGIEHDKCDVLLGNGNEVKNSYLSSFLWGRYENVYCLFDYDLAGVQMYELLSRRSRNYSTNVRFSMPLDLSLCQRSSLCKKPVSHDFNKVLKLSLELGLMELHRNFLETSRFLEQEMIMVNLKRKTIND